MRVFLAAPFSQYLSPNGNSSNGSIVEISHKELLSAIKREFEKNNIEVFLAHEREKWGEALFSPDDCTPLDYKELEASDTVVAIPRESGGVHIELGWASALRKPVTIFLEESYQYSPLILGLGKVTETLYLQLHTERVEALVNECICWTKQQVCAQVSQ